MFCCLACGVGCACGWGDCIIQVFTLIRVILHYYLLPSLSLRWLLLSIAIGAPDLGDRTVFSLIHSCVVLAFGKINLTCDLHLQFFCFLPTLKMLIKVATISNERLSKYILNNNNSPIEDAKTSISSTPIATKYIVKLNYLNFLVITIAFDRIRIRILNPFHKRGLACGPITCMALFASGTLYYR